MPALTSTTGFDIIMKGKKESISTYVRDPGTGDLIDVVGNSTFSMIDIEDDSVAFSEVFSTTGSTHIIHAGPGIYQYAFDTNVYTKQYVLCFDCLLPSEQISFNTFIKTEPSKMFARAAELRIQVDKARKSISDDIENMDKPNNVPATRLFFGFSDAHLIYYLERGAQIVNVVPPYTSLTPISFPWDVAGSVLVDAAVIAALESQGIFAIDTDYSYSLGGNSLVIDHFTKINTYLSGLVARFDKNLVRFKQQFRSKGLVMFQWSPGGVRSARQLSSLPPGFFSRMMSSAFV